MGGRVELIFISLMRDLNEDSDRGIDYWGRCHWSRDLQGFGIKRDPFYFD
jgi:hypothetical protein